MATSVLKNQVRERCGKIFGQTSNTKVLSQIICHILDYEYDVTMTSYRISDSIKRLTEQRNYLTELKQILDDSINVFRGRRDSVERLIKVVAGLPPQLNLRVIEGQEVISQISIRTHRFRVRDGEKLTILQKLTGNMLLVRNEAGDEGKLSALGLLLSAADRTLTQLCTRLQVELIAGWTDHMMLMGSLIQTLVLSSINLPGHSVAVQGHGHEPLEHKETKDIRGELGNPFKTVRRQFEAIREFSRNLANNRNSTDLSSTEGVPQPINDGVADEVATVLQNYRTLYESWYSYHSCLSQQNKQALRLFNNINKFLDNGSNSSQLFRCYKTRLIIESVETREEITHIYDSSSGTRVGGSYSNQSVEAEQLTSSQEEEQQRIIIRSVRDVMNDVDVSLDDAISRGVIDPSAGTFRNLKTGEVLSIAAAMNEGLILVETVTKTRKSVKSEAIGLITIRDESPVTGPYQITGVLDPSTAELLDVGEAERRGLLDLTTGSYVKNSATNQRLDIDDAIEAGWVEVEYETDVTAATDKTRVQTYAVSGVVDQILKRKVDFAEAVRKGLIDRETGNYINNLTGEKVFVVEAIRRGFLKAKLVEDPSTLNIDPVNHVVVERLSKVKALVKGWGAMSALMKTAHKNKE